jgi:hypothetical protein
MRFTNWLLVLPTLCLGVVVLTSFVIFYAFRRGRQAISQLQQDETDTSTDLGDNTTADTHLSRGDLSESSQPKINIEMAACPACGGENPAGAGACAYCGRKL